MRALFYQICRNARWKINIKIIDNNSTIIVTKRLPKLLHEHITFLDDCNFLFLFLFSFFFRTEYNIVDSVLLYTVSLSSVLICYGERT